MTFTITSPEGKKLTLRPTDSLYRFRKQIKRNERVMRITPVLRNLGLLATVVLLCATLGTHSIPLFFIMLLIDAATIVAGIMNYSARQIASSLSNRWLRSRALEARQFGR